ncbi:hypothetical protein IV203_000567 [Nitzschia inconspicua]|uniref:Uncharacterized protein n=1 Tax=Nitzschia inconspicua TaxID=303405 RepID=A0A9K3L6T6_9STRA|nr:hypothetical protein IV203_000567 [Nitzschia inconspicua]
MPRFRSFIQSRLARETTGKGGSDSSIRRRFPSMDRKLGGGLRKRKDDFSSMSDIAKANTAESIKKEIPKTRDQTELGEESIDESRIIVNDIAMFKDTDNFWTQDYNPVDDFEIEESRDDVPNNSNDFDGVSDLEDPINQDTREKMLLPDNVFKSQIEDDSVADGEERNETNHDDESTVMTFQDTFSISLILDSRLAISRSKEEVPRAESRAEGNDLAATDSRASVETGVWDLGALARLLRFVHCTGEDSFVPDDTPDLQKKSIPKNLLEEARASKTNNPQRYFMTGDKRVQIREDFHSDGSEKLPNSGTEKIKEESCSDDFEKISNSRSTHESICSAFSSPSRRGRRTTRPKSPMSINREVDSMIEITGSDQKEEMDLQDHNNDTKHSSDLQYSISDKEVFDGTGSSPDKKPRQDFDFSAYTTIPWTGRSSPIILRDYQTMLPDNLAPMARLRYCSHISGKYGLLVTKERCYV